MAAKIALLFEAGQSVPHSGSLKRLAVKIAQGEGVGSALNVVICSDQKVRQLNRRFRGLDRVTDVLSFDWDDPDFAGEVYISNPQVRRQCHRWKNSYFNELKRVMTHGILHLCGYDHIKSKDREIMRKRENLYLKTPNIL